MVAWVRMLVLVLVALSLPVQGMAAATMACHLATDHPATDHQALHAAPGADRSTAIQTDVHPATNQGMGHSGHHGMHVDPQHAMGSDGSEARHHTAHAGWAADAQGAGGCTDHGVGGPSHHSCSSCSACCLAAALLNAPLGVQAVSLAPTVFDAVVPAVARFVVDGPDRPPRPIVG